MIPLPGIYACLAYVVFYATIATGYLPDSVFYCLLVRRSGALSYNFRRFGIDFRTGFPNNRGSYE